MDDIKVAFAEDNEIYFNGLHTMLEEMPGISLCGGARDGEELVKLLKVASVDVVITDIQMPRQTGVEATRTIVQEHPCTRVIGLTMFSSEYLIVEMLRAGAKGFMDKNSKPDYLYQAIKTVYDGYCYYCPSTSLILMKMIIESKLNLEKGIPFNEHELELIQLFCQEYSSKEIAGKIFISESTVDKHRKKIQEKMGVKSVAGIVMYAVRRGLYKG